MLVLTRKQGEVIHVGDIKIVINRIKGDWVSVGVEAPKDLRISRGEHRNGSDDRK